ncbi:MAG: hypothetical protein ACOYD0_09745 [Candidatus Nanopelagicales bacterium]
MARTMLFGVVCAVLAFLVIMTGQVLNLSLQNVLLSLAVGAALGLVRTNSPVARIGAFLIGFLLGIIFFVLRLAVFPATWLGNAAAVVLIILALTLISALTKDKLPLWAMFLGAAVFAGSYNSYFMTTPWLFESQTVSVAAGSLFAVSAGFFVALLVELREARGGVDSIDPMKPIDPPDGGDAASAPTNDATTNPAGAIPTQQDSGLSVFATRDGAK